MSYDEIIEEVLKNNYSILQQEHIADFDLKIMLEQAIALAELEKKNFDKRINLILYKSVKMIILFSQTLSCVLFSSLLQCPSLLFRP